MDVSDDIEDDVREAPENGLDDDVKDVVGGSADAAFVAVAELEVPDLKDEDGDGSDDVSRGAADARKRERERVLQSEK